MYICVYICASCAQCTVQCIHTHTLTQRVLSPVGWDIVSRVEKQRTEHLEEELSASVNWQQEHKFAVNSNCLACTGTGNVVIQQCS